MLRAPCHKRTCMPRYVNDIHAIPAMCQRYECNMTTIPKDRVDLMCTQHTLLIYVADMPRYGSEKIEYGRDISDRKTIWQKYDSIQQKLRCRVYRHILHIYCGRSRPRCSSLRVGCPPLKRRRRHGVSTHRTLSG